jgi:hypothetical protein
VKSRSRAGRVANVVKNQAQLKRDDGSS